MNERTMQDRSEQEQAKDGLDLNKQRSDLNEKRSNRNLQRCDLNAQRNDLMPRRYHALTLIAYPLLLLLLAVPLQHPLFLGALLSAALFALATHGALRPFFKTMRYVWPWLLLILLLNVLINKNGATVLWKGPRIPVFGELRVTWEALAYSLVMILRMFIMLAATALYLRWLSPDRALSLFARFAGRSAVTSMLTARLFPYLREQAQTVGDVLQTRGVRLNAGGIKQRLQARKPMVQVLLTSALEGSWQVAEAMEARGFGLGKRTSYARESWSRQDARVWVPCLLALGLIIALHLQGMLEYSFYPRLPHLFAGGATAVGGAVLFAVLLALPPAWMKRRRR